MGMVQVGCGLSGSNCSCVLSLKICYLGYTSLLASVTPVKFHNNTNSSMAAFSCVMSYLLVPTHLVLVLLSST